MSIKQVRLSIAGQGAAHPARRPGRGSPTGTSSAAGRSACRSGSPRRPTPVDIPADSNVEMTWQVFGGDAHELYLALLKERCERGRPGHVRRRARPPVPAPPAPGHRLPGHAAVDPLDRRPLRLSTEGQEAGPEGLG